MKNSIKISLIVNIFWLPSLFMQAFAEEFQYVYDDLGQLVKAIDSTGTVVEYIYDSVGNRLEIKRYTVNGIAIFGFTPANAPAGSTITLQGQSFSVILAENIVTIGGVQAVVIAATENILIVEVPTSVSSGEIIVTANGNSSIAGKVFGLLQGPLVTKIEPAILLSESTEKTLNTGFTISGSNLTLSEITFLPEFSPPQLKAVAVTIADDGNSATLDIEVAAGTVGSFTLVATNSIGHSETIGGDRNTITVFDVLIDTDHDLLTDYQEAFLCTDMFNSDSDNDGFSDKDEIDFDSDPCKVDNIPSGVFFPFSITTGDKFTVMNEVFVAPILNELNVNFVASANIVVNNNTTPRMWDYANKIGNAVTVGSIISIQNTKTPNVGNFSNAIGLAYSGGVTVSIQNSSLPEIVPVIKNFAGEVFIDGSQISIRNDAFPVIETYGTTGKAVTGGSAISVKNN